MDTKPKPSGVDGMGDLSLGTHFCVFYETEQDLLDILTFYFKPGLANHEFCLWLTPDSSIQEARLALKQVISSAERYLEAGDIEIISCQQFYCPDDVFDAANILQSFHLKIAQALEKGYARVRVLSDASWLEKEDWSAFYDFEGKIDESLSSKPISILCAYPNANFSAADLFDIAQTHDFIVAKRNGTWQILESPALKQVKADTERDIRELDHWGIEQKGIVWQAGDELTIRNQLLQAEIIERKQREEALEETSLRLQVALQAAQIGTGEWDIQTNRATMSEGLRRIFGFSPGTTHASLEAFIERIHPEDREQFRRKVQEALAGKTDFGMDYRTVWPDGSIHWVTARAHISYDPSGKPTRFVGAAMDISDRKKAEEALRESEERFSKAFHADPIPATIARFSDGRFVDVNQAFLDLTGYQRDEVIGRSALDLHLNVDPEVRAGLMRKLSYGETVRGAEARYRTKEGKILAGLVSMELIEVANAPCVLNIVLDITERKQAEESLRESQQLLHLVLATLPVGVMVTDQDDNIILVNEASKRIWGGTIISGPERRKQSKGFWHASGERIVPQNWASARALSEGQTSLNELIDIETFTGQRKIIHNSVAPIRNAEDRIVGAVIVNEDVTEQVRAEEAVRRHAARMEALARIAARLNRQLDLDTVVRAVCQEVVDTFKASQATMTLYDKESDMLVYTGGVNIPPEYAATIEPTARTKFDEFLRAMGPIMVVPDIQSVPDVPNAEFNSHFDVRTVVTAAMLRDEELIGVVALGVNGHIREFTKDELTLLKAISDQAAQALANAQLLKAAEEQHEQLRALSIRLVETQETERRAIARELHDDIGQTLTGLMMQLGTAKSRLPKSAKSVHSTLEQSEALIQEILEHTRSIITDLRPQVLDDLGLVPALQRLGDDFQENTGVKVEMNLARLPKRLPSRLEDSLFRIVQEALTNVRKHARANRVSIAMVKEKALVILSVQDDGLGFEKQITRSRASGEMVIEGGWLIPAGHFGLIGIQERAAQLAGTLQVTSAPGRGTTLRVELPLSEETVGSDERL